MPFSTSDSSSSTLPLLSISLREPSRPMVQAATVRRSGKATPHAGAIPTARPGGTGSSLKVTVQRRSRSGLDNSHIPTSAFAASVGSDSGCANAGVAAKTRPIARNLSMPLTSMLEPLFLHRRLGNRRERPLAGEERHDVVGDQFVHPAPRRVRGRSDVRQQYEVIHVDQVLRDLRLVGEYIEPGGEDGLVLERLDQCVF